MPEMHFDIVWPNGVPERCYSPSLVIKDHLAVGASYVVTEFRARCRTALQTASERVQQKFGFPCSRALGQLAMIEAACDKFSGAESPLVRVEAFHE